MTQVEAPAPSEVRGLLVRRAGQLRSVWEHEMGNGVDWTEALRREYWEYHFGRFSAGDRVEIFSFDHRVQFNMLILDINTASDPVYFEAVFLPVYPTDLQLPKMEPQLVPRYQVRQAPGFGGLYNVVDTVSGKPVQDNAQHRAATLERGIKAAAEQVVDLAKHRGSKAKLGDPGRQ